MLGFVRDVRARVVALNEDASIFGWSVVIRGNVRRTILNMLYRLEVLSQMIIKKIVINFKTGIWYCSYWNACVRIKIRKLFNLQPPPW